MKPTGPRHPAKAEGEGLRVAYLILAHRYPEQIVRLIKRLDSESATFLVHLDRKTDDRIYHWLVQQLGGAANVHFVRRYTCYWAGFGIVQATIQGIRDVIEKRVPFDYLALLTGQDYPIKTNEYIRQFFQERKGVSFISHNPFPYDEWKCEDGGWDRVRLWHIRSRGRYFVFPRRRAFENRALNLTWNTAARLFPVRRHFPEGFHPYGGAQPWCLYAAHVRQIYEFMRRNRRFVRFFRFVNVADEIFFQTIVGNSRYAKELQNDTLTYVEWYRPGAILRSSDFGVLRSTYHLFARKFDATVDAAILDRIDRELLGALP